MQKQLLFSALCLTLSANAAQTCNPNIQATTPDSRFTTTAGTVTDTKTSLMWMRCSLGQSGNDCSGGNATKYNWQQALASAAAANTANLGGHNDWRLPNIKELASIVELQCVEPAINLTIFPNTPSSGYSSSSPRTYGDNHVWAVHFGYGISGYGYSRDSRIFVRLVRGGQ
ncbi:MAG: hypothetical protein CSA51_03200 [Gammaproteobacteria bacterium]|nr:MAG: hypothetical protein CSA51_03200 [Gammaproteobacteria bacterium]